MPSSQENVSAMRRLPDNNLSPDFELLLLVPQIHRCMFLCRMYRNLARQWSTAEREDSTQKRQRPAEVNTVFLITGGLQWKRDRILDRRPKSTTQQQQKELLIMDKFGVVGVVDTPPSQEVLSTPWVQKRRLDGSYKMRIMARGFGQTVSLDADFYAGAPRLTT